MKSKLTRICFLALIFVLSGCAGPRLMMPTPNLYLDESHDWYGDLPPRLRSTEVRLFYITDRVPEDAEEGNLRYGYGRSPSLAFGTAVVDLGVGITWEELLEASRTQTRSKKVVLKLGVIKEIFRTPDLPLPYKEVDGQIIVQPDLLVEDKTAREVFRHTLTEQLALTPRKEVFIYVHGFDNSFKDAAFVMAEFWHFLGRIGVPMIYTWPAGYPGLFGYTYDRESSEFTIYHLRETLSFLASFPEVEKIHLIAHSRGTGVAIAAVRELTISARATGIDPKAKFKIHNLVLAAPDLDVQVSVQRIAGDKLDYSVNRFTIYTSSADAAIGAATWLFSSPRGRVGTFGMEDMSEVLKAVRKFSPNSVTVINYSPAPGSLTGSYGHSYFRTAPTVSSDLVLMLRDDLDAGTPGRPLKPIGPGFWRIPLVYPAAQPAQ
jgi:esterase/lipase superfamily enzyme